MVWVFDLQQLGFVLLCAGMLAGAGVVWARRRRSGGRRDGSGIGEPALLDVLDRAPFGLVILEGPALQYSNVEARELLHLPQSSDEGLPPTDWSDLLREDLAVVRLDAVGDVGLELPTPEGRPHPEGRLRPTGRFRNVTFASGNTVRWWVVAQATRDFVILFDISAQQRAMQMGRSLVSDLGHELRTPIATLLTHLEILKLDDVGEEVHLQSLQFASQEAQRMARLVNDMLELGRLEMTETLTFRPVSLMKLVEEAVIQMTPSSAARGIGLDVMTKGPLPLVAGNADRLRQVLLNLLDNAVKYAGADARVTVSLETLADGVQCAVSDTGPGIGPEHLPHITRRFYRASPDTIEGSGLGLALVAEILRRHHTALEIISPVAEGRGTRVQFTLAAAGPAGSTP
jgi:two-component system, OmpR family, phosphate regulon sensor histidine kinase PhoR